MRTLSTFGATRTRGDRSLNRNQDMKHSIKYTTIASWMALAALPVLADQTNMVRSLQINLTGIQQGPATTVKNTTTTTVKKINLGNDDIIGALSQATGARFSSNAQLVVVSPLPFGDESIQVQDGGNKVDVTPFFTQNYLSLIVGKSTVNQRTGVANGSDYSVQQFILQDWAGYPPLGLHYVVSGIATENFKFPPIPGPRHELSAEVSGAGDIDGDLVILQGTIKVTSQNFEVVPSGGDPTS